MLGVGDDLLVDELADHLDDGLLLVGLCRCTRWSRRPLGRSRIRVRKTADEVTGGEPYVRPRRAPGPLMNRVPVSMEGAESRMTEGSSPQPSGGVRAPRPSRRCVARAPPFLPACAMPRGRYVAVDPAFADLVGLEASRLVGKTDNALQTKPPTWRTASPSSTRWCSRPTGISTPARRSWRATAAVPCAACRFPVYDGGEPWAICVVMAPGDDLVGAAREGSASACAGLGGPGH